MRFELPSFQIHLNGETAFYKQSNYLESTQRELTLSKTLPSSYKWSSEHKAMRIAKQLFSFVIFPIGLYQFLHNLVGKVALLPSSSPNLFGGFLERNANHTRECIEVDNEWKYKRLTVEGDGYKIDAMIVGKESTLNNGRWTLISNGNNQFYEDHFSFNRKNTKQILTSFEANAIVFNYPGVGSSSGLPSRQAMAKAYRAMLNFLEDGKKGIGAKEIIGYGHSIGAGVQAEALKEHSLKEDVKYVFVKSRTFSDLSTTASDLSIRTSNSSKSASLIASFLTKNRFLGFLVKLLNWNIDPLNASKKLQAPEIILQTADVSFPQEMKDSSKIIDDGIISTKASLAKKMLDNEKYPKTNKIFIGIPERHNDPFDRETISFLAAEIKKQLTILPLTHYTKRKK